MRRKYAALLSPLCILSFVSCAWSTLFSEGLRADDVPDIATVEYSTREVDKRELPGDNEWYVSEKPVIRKENGTLLSSPSDISEKKPLYTMQGYCGVKPPVTDKTQKAD